MGRRPKLYKAFGEEQTMDAWIVDERNKHEYSRWTMFRRINRFSEKGHRAFELALTTPPRGLIWRTENEPEKCVRTWRRMLDGWRKGKADVCKAWLKGISSKSTILIEFGNAPDGYYNFETWSMKNNFHPRHEDMRLSRIDPHQPYGPKNCIWSRSITHLAREKNVSVNTVRARLRKGTPLNRALSTGGTRRKK